jgi:hypothetical protein
MRWLLLVFLAGSFLLLSADQAAAQSAGGASGPDITVQLPGFHATGVNTTVLVPDRGPAQLSRQRQAMYERTQYGRYARYRPTTRQQLTSSLHVTAHQYDPRAAEANQLSISRSRRANWTRGTTFGSRR